MKHTRFDVLNLLVFSTCPKNLMRAVFCSLCWSCPTHKKTNFQRAKLFLGRQRCSKEDGSGIIPQTQLAIFHHWPEGWRCAFISNVKLDSYSVMFLQQNTKLVSSHKRESPPKPTNQPKRKLDVHMDGCTLHV